MNEIATLETHLTALMPNFAQALGTVMPPERLIRTIMISVERLPKLLGCDRQSLFNSAMSAAVLGLEVDGVTGQAFLVPFKQRAQLIIGYKGYNTLAARAGITITGACVREGDEFEYELGSRAFVRHRPKLGNAGRIIAAWACAAAKDRPPVIAVLSIDELMAVKAKSPGAKMSDSPWNNEAIGFPAMCEKTAKRRLARSLPLNTMQLAARLDEVVDEQGKGAWINPEQNLIIDAEVATTSETPEAAALIAPKASPPPLTIPAWDEYCDRWEAIVAEARDADQLRSTWNSEVHKELRRQIIWPEIGTITPDPLDALKEKIGAAIAALGKGDAT